MRPARIGAAFEVIEPEVVLELRAHELLRDVPIYDGPAADPRAGRAA